MPDATPPKGQDGSRSPVASPQLTFQPSNSHFTSSSASSGISLRLDLAFGAANGDFDVVVLFSGDSDLLPALERAHAAGVTCETAAWTGGRRRQQQKGYLRWEHRLGQRDYDVAHDSFDYGR